MRLSREAVLADVTGQKLFVGRDVKLMAVAVPGAPFSLVLGPFSFWFTSIKHEFV